MDKGHPPSQGSVAAAALDALQQRKAEGEAQKAIAGEDVSSLNKLLQWSTANSANDSGIPSEGYQKAVEKDPEQVEADRQWLDAAFPDMYAEIKVLIGMLEKEDVSTDETVDVLEGLQEYFADLNYAVNIDKLGALDPILRCTKEESACVRAAAVWVLGTALQDLDEVKQTFMKKDGHLVLAEALKDADATVRAKAVMASSALLRNSDQDIHRKFKEAGGVMSLRYLISDANVQVRRRARFFLQHAPVTGNAAFVTDLLVDRNAIAAFSESFEQLSLDDVFDVEAAVGALGVLVDADKQGLLQVAPELPGIVDALVEKCGDHDLSDMLAGLSSRLG